MDFGLADKRALLVAVAEAGKPSPWNWQKKGAMWWLPLELN